MEKREKSKDNTYQTPHFYLSVWFIMNEMELTGIDRTNPQRLIFVFKDCEKRKELFNEFWKNEFIQKFISYVQELKVQMYASNPPMIFKNNKDANNTI